MRGIKTLEFGGTKEEVIERSDFPRQKLQQIFGKDTMAVIGYGVQGRAQSQNMRDNGVCAFTVSINPVELQTHYLCRDISLFSLPFCDISLPSLFPCACVGVFCALSK